MRRRNDRTLRVTPAALILAVLLPWIASTASAESSATAPPPEPAANPATTAPAPGAKTDTAAAPAPDKAPGDKQPARSAYKPTEEVSADNAVPFPVDI